MDPSDPIIPFILFLGVSTAFWYEHPSTPYLIVSCYFPVTIKVLPPFQICQFNLYRKLNCLSDFCRAFYWKLTYGGYAGDLSPKSSFELLKGDRKAVLIDIRPEARHCIYIKSCISAEWFIPNMLRPLLCTVFHCIISVNSALIEHMDQIF